VHPLLADPWIAARVDAAVAPYVGRLPASEVSWMRDQLAEVLASDDEAAKLLHRARPTVVEKSGEVARADRLGAAEAGAAGAAATDTPSAPEADRPGLAKRPKAAG
jgi:hypothetical protein